MSNEIKKTYTFHVSGMHCAACEHLIEDGLTELEGVSSANANLKNQSVQVIGDFPHMTESQIAEVLSRPIAEHGYTLSTERKTSHKNWSDFKVAVPIALVGIVGFILLQKAGIMNLIGQGNVSYGTAFVVGIVSSLSTCMAVVGGLLLSMSATFAKEKSTFVPQVLFHVGRIVSFFILGGIIGALGTVFTLSTTMTFILFVLIGIVMLILGVNLLDVFNGLGAFQIRMPRFMAKYALSVSNFNHTATPFLVGIATFFLPCGFTQSMQLYTLSTGGFMEGGLTMLAFALGTFPVLALLSFSSFSIQKSSFAGIFFKTAGLIVIAFALMNIINSLVIIGLISPIFTF